MLILAKKHFIHPCKKSKKVIHCTYKYVFRSATWQKKTNKNRNTLKLWHNIKRWPHSRQLRFSTITQPFYNSSITFNNRGWFTRSKCRRLIIIPIIYRSARINCWNIRKEHRTIRRSAITEHVFVTVTCKTQMLEKLF